MLLFFMVSLQLAMLSAWACLPGALLTTRSLQIAQSSNRFTRISAVLEWRVCLEDIGKTCATSAALASI